MTNTPRNPQAYPSDAHPGMTLRDAFALAAMQGIVSGPLGMQANEAVTAKWAYQQADAMLKARGESQ